VNVHSAFFGGSQGNCRLPLLSRASQSVPGRLPTIAATAASVGYKSRNLRHPDWPCSTRNWGCTAPRLLGAHSTWMVRYRPLLSEAEFTKFAVLATGLSPFIAMLINPESRSRRLDRNPTIGRQNLLWAIHGHPDAKPLFP